ncbi:MAG: helix-turn-helix domain-containing protein [Myxococcales bacterium]|nr:helix-turn-helix domain-containing protein [Myxococcales bacterium]
MARGRKSADVPSKEAPLQGSSLGDRIKAAYLRAGLRRSDFAKLVDVSYPTVMNWEKAKTSPNHDNLLRIAEVTGRSLEELVGEARLELETTSYPAFAEFLKSELGRSMSADERETLASVRFRHGRPTVALYQSWLLGMRSGLTDDQARESERVMTEAEARAKAAGLRRPARPKGAGKRSVEPSE